MSLLMLACSVCGGDPNSLFSKGILAGIFFLMALIACILGGILWTGIVWARRAKRLHSHL